MKSIPALNKEKEPSNQVNYTDELDSQSFKKVEHASCQPRVGTVIISSSVDDNSGRSFDNLVMFQALAQYIPLQMRQLSIGLPDPIVNSDRIRVVINSVDLSDPANEKLLFAQKNNLKIKIKNIKNSEDIKNLIINECFFNQIEVIEFDDINCNNIENIQKFLNLAQNLVSFSCNSIGDNVTLTFPHNLRFFFCGGNPIKKNVTLIFPENLISFFCKGCIWDITRLKLPENLKSFSCLVIESNTTLKFPKNLSSFSCGYIGRNRFSLGHGKYDQNVDLTFSQNLISFV